MSANGSGSGFNNSSVPLSAPGALSTRTDMQSPMQIPDAAYGEQQEFNEIQRGAQMQGGMTPPPDLFSGTARPDVPVTDGADYGPGLDQTALPTGNVMDADNEKIAKYLPQFEMMAALDDTPDSFRQFVKYLRGSK